MISSDKTDIGNHRKLTICDMLIGISSNFIYLVNFVVQIDREFANHKQHKNTVYEDSPLTGQPVFQKPAEKVTTYTLTFIQKSTNMCFVSKHPLVVCGGAA